MTEILITFSQKIEKFRFQGDLSHFYNEILSNYMELDKNNTKNNISIKYCSDIIADSAYKVIIKIFNALLGQDLDGSLKLTAFIERIAKIFNNYSIPIDQNEIYTKVETYNNSNKNSINNLKDISTNKKQERDSDFDIEKKSEQFTPVEPNYTFDRVIIAEEIKDEIRKAISLVDCRKTVFEEWGLNEIEPNPSTSLNFYGPSGTGKTMCAEAVASELGKKILRVSYSDVESKYHGEGPKMVRAIFYAAEKENAVLFFDEADSLLSKRLTNVSDGSAQAINSMRSQLLISLENFNGVVIFATNLKENYDPAFCTRLHSIEFKKPDENIREQIWYVHLHHRDDKKEQVETVPITDEMNINEKSSEIEHKKKPLLNIPLASNVDENIKLLAKKFDDFVGRDIRNSVIRACVNVAFKNNKNTDKDKVLVKLDDIIEACNIINEEKRKEKKAQEKLCFAEKAGQFIPVTPKYNLDSVITTDETKAKLRKAISLVGCRKTVFEKWGLYEIEPTLSTSLSFYGASGTGKSMCAEAVASELGKKILRVSYADFETKYQSEGPNIIKAIFAAAEKENAVLFFDEADLLLSERVLDSSDFYTQSINSMRSQLLISLDNFNGVVIFATNPLENYHPTFSNRLHCIEFKKPDEKIREEIWNAYLHHKVEVEGSKKTILNIPLDNNIDIKQLSKRFDNFVGRDIKNSVIKACVNKAYENENNLDGDKIVITLEDICNACSAINDEKKKEIYQQQNLTPDENFPSAEQEVQETKTKQKVLDIEQNANETKVILDDLPCDESSEYSEKTKQKHSISFWKRSKKNKLDK